MGNAGQDRCVYCGVIFVDDYYFGCCSAWITSSSRRIASGCAFTLFGITPFPASSWPAPAATRSTTGTKSHGSVQRRRRYGRRMNLPPCGTASSSGRRHVFSNGAPMPFGSSSRRFRGDRAFPVLGRLIDGEGGLFCLCGGREAERSACPRLGCRISRVWENSRK